MCEKRMNRASKTAVGGIVTAISVATMFLTAVIPFLTYILPIAAALLLSIVTRELGRGWAAGVYLAVGTLGMLVVADKEAALMYIAFFGYYPLIKDTLDRLPRIVRILLKLIIFNASVTAAYFVIIKLFGMDSKEFNELGRFTVPVLLVLGNIVFVLFDRMLGTLCVLYDKRLKSRIHRMFR